MGSGAPLHPLSATPEASKTVPTPARTNTEGCENQTIAAPAAARAMTRPRVAGRAYISIPMRVHTRPAATSVEYCFSSEEK